MWLTREEGKKLLLLMMMMLTCRGRVDLTLRQSVSKITFVEGRKAGRINEIHFLTERTVTLLA